MKPPARYRSAVRAAFLRALRLGLSPEQAGNAVAQALDIRPSPRSPWTTDEIEHLLAMRYEWERGRWI